MSRLPILPKVRPRCADLQRDASTPPRYSRRDRPLRYFPPPAVLSTALSTCAQPAQPWRDAATQRLLGSPSRCAAALLGTRRRVLRHLKGHDRGMEASKAKEYIARKHNFAINSKIYEEEIYKLVNENNE